MARRLHSMGSLAAEHLSPIAERRLHQRQRRNARGIGPQDPWPERKPYAVWLAQQSGPLLLGEPAFGSDQDVDAMAAFAACKGMPRVGDVSRFIAKDEEAVEFPALQETIKSDGFCDLGNAENAALLGGLDDIGPHPLAIDPGDLSETGQDRLKRGGAHLDRFLHHVIEPRVLERREHISEVRQAVLRPGLAFDVKTIPSFAPGDRSQPFAVAGPARTAFLPVAAMRRYRSMSARPPRSRRDPN